MTKYSVRITDAAMVAIEAQARFIAVDSQAPLTAQHWLESIWDAVDSLEQLPHHGSLSQESAYVRHEVRQLVIGSLLLLYSVDDDKRAVWILGLRHGHRLPRPHELGDDPQAGQSSQ